MTKSIPIKISSAATAAADSIGSTAEPFSQFPSEPLLLIVEYTQNNDLGTLEYFVNQSSPSSMRFYLPLVNRSIANTRIITKDRSHSLLTPDGRLWVCGRNDYGQLGLGHHTYNQRAWAQSATKLPPIRQMSQNHHSTFALTEEGRLWVCGRNDYGQLGLGHRNNQYTWVQSGEQLGPIWRVFNADSHCTFLITTIGQLWACGHNDYGQLGLGHNNIQRTWVQSATELPPIRQVSQSDYSTFALTEEGHLWVCGHNNYGQLGLGHDNIQRTWVQSAKELPPIRQVSHQGNFSTFALTEEGRLWICGRNDYDQLGLGHTNDQYTWVQNATELPPIRQLSQSQCSTVALTQEGHLWVHGANDRGQLGLGHNNFQCTWVQSATELPPIRQVSQNNCYTFALTQEGRLWICGNNNYNQFILEHYDTQFTWVQCAQQLSPIQQVITDRECTLLLTAEGHLESSEEKASHFIPVEFPGAANLTAWFGLQNKLRRQCFAQFLATAAIPSPADRKIDEKKATAQQVKSIDLSHLGLGEFSTELLSQFFKALPKLNARFTTLNLRHNALEHWPLQTWKKFLLALPSTIKEVNLADNDLKIITTTLTDLFSDRCLFLKDVKIPWKDEKQQADLQEDRILLREMSTFDANIRDVHQQLAKLDATFNKAHSLFLKCKCFNKQIKLLERLLGQAKTPADKQNIATRVSTLCQALLNILLLKRHRAFLYPEQEIERTYAHLKMAEVLRTYQAIIFCASHFKNLLMVLFDFPNNLQHSILSLCLPSTVADRLRLMVNASWKFCQKPIFECIVKLQEINPDFCEQLCIAALDDKTFLGQIFHVRAANARRNPAEFFAAGVTAAAVCSGAASVRFSGSTGARYLTELQALLDKLRSQRQLNCMIS